LLELASTPHRFSDKVTMQVRKFLLLFAVGAFYGTVAEETEANPLSKVFQLIGDLKAKIIADGEAEARAFKEYSQWCRSTSSSVANEIDTSTALVNKLTAKVTELDSDIEVGDTKIGDLSAAVSKAEAELKQATAIRTKEAEEFSVGERELMATVDTLERALSTLEKPGFGPGGSFAQIDTSNLSTLLQSLSAVTEAAGFTGSSKDKLLALVQAHDEEDDLGAPAAAAHQSQSGGIMDMLEDMKDKAEGQLGDLRKTETKARNSYGLLKQSLEDEIKAMTNELNDEKTGKAEAAEEKASSQGNLEVATQETKTSTQKEDQVRSDCQTVASDHESNVAARKQELKTIGEAERILQETTGGAESRQYSFLQTASASRVSQRVKSRQLAKTAVISMVQHLAKEQHCKALAQLASRISAEMKYGHRGNADPFAKVKNLITSMIDKLEREASEEATEKAYCDEQMAKTQTKQGELEDTISKLSAKIEKSASKSAALKEEVSELMSELSDLTKEQTEMDNIRRQQQAAFQGAKKDLELGLGGVRKALTVLRDFYAAPKASLIQSDEDDDQQMSSLMQQAASQPAPPQQAEKSTGAGGGIIGLLEVIESDFAKNLATEDAEESDASSEYEKQTQANKITKTQKEQDAKFKTQEFKALDKSISELEADKATENQELSAVNEYFGKIKERCVAKPSSYEERKARRDAEIKGLKDALASLESEALMQIGSQRATRRAHLRGELRTD